MKRFRKFILLMFLVPLFGGTVYSEETEAIFAPFVSRLEAEVKNGFIRLTWEDSHSIAGPVFIYRSDTPFPVSPLPQGVEVPYGSRSYVDEAERPGIFHYLAVSSDGQGRKYIIPIPYTNTVSVTVDEADAALFVNNGEVLSYGETAEKTIRAVSAKADNGRVVLGFEGEGKDAVFYRSTRPIRTRDDLLQAVIVGRGSPPPFIDYPAPGIPYYYAVIPEEDLYSSRAPVTAGKNATTEPVEIREERTDIARSGQIRTIPLPGITVESARNGLSPDTAASPLSKEARRAALSLAGPSAAESAGRGQSLFREPGVFPEDTNRAPDGESGQLGRIIQGPFSGRRWEEAGEELRRFLSLPRSVPVENRSRFYLGQVYYFTGKPREALFEFLAARNTYPGETKPWIDAVLARLVD
ncbi:MAG: hypothetical protein LBI67_09880 [Treponema sp.]|jgi:hypothetical protein|nr:hypothetical protein [Treponema sp.]